LEIKREKLVGRIPKKDSDFAHIVGGIIVGTKMTEMISKARD
jgi:hypothetical protein